MNFCSECVQKVTDGDGPPECPNHGPNKILHIAQQEGFTSTLTIFWTRLCSLQEQTCPYSTACPSITETPPQQTIGSSTVTATNKPTTVPPTIATGTRAIALPLEDIAY